MCWRSDASVLLCSGIMFVTIPTDGGSISDRYTRGVRLDTLNILGFAFQFAVLGIVPICAVRPERASALLLQLLVFCCAWFRKRFCQVALIIVALVSLVKPLLAFQR